MGEEALGVDAAADGGGRTAAPRTAAVGRARERDVHHVVLCQPAGRQGRGRGSWSAQGSAVTWGCAAWGGSGLKVMP